MHDSFWTHAADVPRMNEILREQFVVLHSRPILEDLAARFKVGLLITHLTDNARLCMYRLQIASLHDERSCLNIFRLENVCLAFFVRPSHDGYLSLRIPEHIAVGGLPECRVPASAGARDPGFVRRQKLYLLLQLRSACYRCCEAHLLSVHVCCCIRAGW